MEPVQMLGRAGLGQPGIQKVPLRHAGHLSWGCVSQHSWSLPSTLCSEVVAPGTWGCVFGFELVEALLSVWLALWGWSFARGPLLSDSPLCGCLWCRVLSFPCCLFPSFTGPAKGPFVPFSAGFRRSVAACVTRVTPSFLPSLPRGGPSLPSLSQVSRLGFFGLPSLGQ